MNVNRRPLMLTGSMPSYKVYQSHTLKRYSMPIITQFGSEVKLEFTESDLASSCVSSLALSRMGLSMVMRCEDAFKLPHEIVSHVLFGTSDVSFRKVTGLDSERTPDCLIKVGDQVIIGELKTSSSFVGVTEKRVQGERTYVDEASQLSSRFKVTVFGVGVNLDSIDCPIDLTQDEVDDVCSLFRWAGQIVEKMYSLGFTKQSDLDETQMKIKLSLQRIKEPEASTDPLKYDKTKYPSFDGLAHMNYMSDLSIKSVEALKSMSDPPANESMALSFINSYSEGERRDDLKAVVQLPMVHADNGSLETGTFFIRSDGSAIANLWVACYTEMCLRSDSPYEEEIEMSLNPDQDSKPSRKNRISVNLTEDEKEELACFGVEGKSSKNSDIKRVAQDRSRLPFSFETQTNDIEKFVSSRDHWEASRHLTLPAVSLNQAVNSVTNEDSEYVTAYQQTRLFRCLDFLDNVVQEVNPSRLQNCRKGEFVLKRIPSYQAWILIKPTKGDRQVFFSLLVKGDPMTLPFKVPRRELSDRIWIYDFVSLDQHKISNLLHCQWRALSILLALCSSFRVDPGMETDEVLSHANAAILIYLEDKEQTSADLQNIRYAYMELMKPYVLKSEPLKILSKLNSRPKSRLLLWIHKQIINSFLKMSQLRPSMDLGDNPEDTDISGDNFRDLLSWVTLKPLPCFETAICLSYFGQFHDKDEGDRLHGFLKIFQKVIKEELELRNTRMEKMNGDPSLPLKTHEFSSSFVRKSAEFMMEQVSGTEAAFKQWFEREGLKALSKISIEELSTFKSTNIPNLSDRFEPGTKGVQRTKVIDSALKMVEDLDIDDNCVFTKIDSVIEKLETEGFSVSLFKKNQLTGVREIFILNFEARVAVKACEVLAETINKMLPNEMLSKGSEKLRRAEQHYKRVASVKTDSDGVITTCDSCDATTWAQRFTMFQFSQFFSVLSKGTCFENLFPRVFNMMIDKKLQLPDELLEAFAKMPEITSFDPGMTELKRQWLGLSQHSDLINPGGRRLSNRSNMMQGIPHNMSSTMHAAAQLLCSSIIARKCKKFLRGFRHNIIITERCSSDDSAYETSLVVPSFVMNDRALLGRCQWFLMWCSEFRSNLMQLWGAKESFEKSTRMVFSNVSEFNSDWRIRNTLCSVQLKFVWAATKLPCTTSFIKRQMHQYVSRNQMLERGCSLNECFIMSRIQLRIYLASLGIKTQRSFGYFFKQILECRHPLLGYPIVPKRMLSGIETFDMSLYSLLATDEIPSKLHRLLYMRGGLKLDTTGEMRSFVELNFGAGRKLNDFLKKLHVKPEELRDTFEIDPSLLYRSPSNKDEVSNRIKLKLLNSTAGESFMFLAESKMMASTVFILNSACITSNLSDKKESMISLLNKVKSMKDESVNESLTSEEICLLFPYHEVYDELFKLTTLQTVLIPCRPASKRKLEFSVAKPTLRPLVPLITVCRTVWGGEDRKTSRALYSQSWEYYSSTLPWLKESLKDTLEQSPFRDHISLFSYINSLSEKTWRISLISPARSRLGHVETIQNIVQRNTFRSSHVSFVFSEDLKADTRQTLFFKPLCMRMMNHWSTRKAEMVQNYLASVPSTIRNSQDLGVVLSTWSKQDSRLRLAHHLLRETNHGMKVMDLPICYWWTRPQERKADGSYSGKGQMLVSLPKCTVIFNINEHNKISVETTDVGELSSYSSEVFEMLRNSNISDYGPNQWIRARHYLGKFGVSGFKSGWPVTVTKIDVVKPQTPICCTVSSDGYLAIRAKSIDGSIICKVWFNGSTLAISDPNIDLPGILGITKKWIQNVPLDEGDVIGDYEEIKQNREWFKEALMKRCHFRMKRVSRNEPIVPREIPNNTVIDDDDIRLAIDLTMDLGIDDIDDAFGFIDEVPLREPMIDGFQNDEVLYQRALEISEEFEFKFRETLDQDVANNSVFFDNFIDESVKHRVKDLLAVDGRKLLTILSNKVASRDITEGFVWLTCALYGIEMRQIRAIFDVEDYSY